MNLPAFRDSEKLTQAEAAARLGLRSAGHLSDIERGVRPAGLRLALEIEMMTAGAVSASSLVNRADAALLAAHCRFAAARNVSAAA